MAITMILESPSPCPGIRTYASGGVNMAASTACGYAYVAYADPTGRNIYGARTQDGVNWDGGHLIWSASAVLTSSPALYGANSALPVGFAFPQYNGFGYQANGGSSGPVYTYIYNVQMGQFNCDFSNPRLLSNNCLFWNAAKGTCQDTSISSDDAMEYDEGYVDYVLHYTGIGAPSGPWSPLWTGADGVELRAVARGNPLGNVSPGIWYSTNQGSVSCVGGGCSTGGGNWSNNGLGGAVNPADGTPFLVASCREFNSDTCGGSNPWIDFHNLSNGYGCTEAPGGDWSIAMPSMTFFNGMLWIAWRGGSQDTNISLAVASLDPATLEQDFSMSASPGSQTVYGLYVTAYYTISVTGLNGFNGTVSLSDNCAGTTLSCSESPSQIGPGQSSTLSVTGSAPGTFSVTVQGVSGTVAHSVSVLYTVRATQ